MLPPFFCNQCTMVDSRKQEIPARSIKLVTPMMPQKQTIPLKVYLTVFHALPILITVMSRPITLPPPPERVKVRFRLKQLICYVPSTTRSSQPQPMKKLRVRSSKNIINLQCIPQSPRPAMLPESALVDDITTPAPFHDLLLLLLLVLS